jgi:hypothetical protein
MARTVKTNRASPSYIDGLSILAGLGRCAVSGSDVWMVLPTNVADEFLERKHKVANCDIDVINMKRR